MLVSYLNNPSEESILGNNRIKKQHETMKLRKMKKLCLAIRLKPLMNSTDQHSSQNIDIAKIFCVLHNKVALLTDVLSREQEIVTKEFLERLYL